MLYRQVIEAVGRGAAAALDDLLATDVVDHNPLPEQRPGPPGFEDWMSAVRASFPDLTGTVEDVVAEGDRVAGRVGTPSGDFLGVAPTARPVAFTAIHIVRIEHGRIAGWWGAANLLDALGQIGAR